MKSNIRHSERQEKPSVSFRWAAALILLALCGTPWATESPTKPGPQKQVLSITDIHFNPFFDSTLVKQLLEKPYQQWDKVFAQSKQKYLPKYKQETNPLLFSTALQAMKKQARQISGILFTGDVLAHDFNKMIQQYTADSSQYRRNQFIHKTMGYVSMKIQEAFPSTPVYFTLGNNDSYEGDYALVDDGEFLHTTADLFYKHFIRDRKDSVDFYKTYPVHGYYNIISTLAEKNRIIAINTIYFSVKYTQTNNNPGSAELDWLEQQLANAKQAGERVWLLLHIPPGINVFSTQQNSLPQSPQAILLWQKSNNDRYLDLIRRYSTTIAASFAGHTHMDDFRIISSAGPNAQALGFIHITPSVTPVFANNPAFQIISYDAKSGELTESKTYSIDLNNKTPIFQEEYVWTQSYQAAPNLSGLAALYPSLLSDSTKRNSYINFYSVSAPAEGISTVWQWYWCGIGYLTSDDFLNAYKQFQTGAQK